MTLQKDVLQHRESYKLSWLFFYLELIAVKGRCFHLPSAGRSVGRMLSRYMHNTQLLAASAVLEVRKQLTYISTVTLKCDIGLKHTSMHWAKGNRHLFLTRCVGLNFGDVSGVVTNWNTLPIRASSQTTFNSLIVDELTFKTFSIMINTLHMKLSRLVKLNTGQILCVNSAT